jgi:hypothetical protein
MYKAFQNITPRTKISCQTIVTKITSVTIVLKIKRVDLGVKAVRAQASYCQLWDWTWSLGMENIPETDWWIWMWSAGPSFHRCGNCPSTTCQLSCNLTNWLDKPFTLYRLRMVQPLTKCHPRLLSVHCSKIKCRCTHSTCKIMAEKSPNYYSLKKLVKKHPGLTWVLRHSSNYAPLFERSWRSDGYWRHRYGQL